MDVTKTALIPLKAAVTAAEKVVDGAKKSFGRVQNKPLVLD